MARSILIVFSLALLFLVNVQHASAFDHAIEGDGPIAKASAQRQVINLFYQGDFAELEKLANNLRSTEAKYPDGTWKLHNFYQAFVHPKNEDNGGWERYIPRLEKWLAKYPKSVTARTAAATGWLAYAWDARGGGYANNATQQVMPLFHERLAKAASYIEIKPGKTSLDCPERFSILLNLANYRGIDRVHFESLFHEAMLSFPDYQFYYCLDKAKYLLPSWNGSREELDKFLKEVAALPPGSKGKTIYAAIIMNYWGPEFKSFEGNRISWELMKQGFLELRRGAPPSPFVLNRFCMFACFAGDKQTARQLFAEIGDHPYLDSWDRYRQAGEFLKWRAWAFLDDKQVKKSSFLGGTEDFRQMLTLAENGDTEAQCQVGLMLDQGLIVKRDPGEAFKWLVKAAQQGHPGAQRAVADFYYSGRAPVERDLKKAAHGVILSALQGDINAAGSLGNWYQNGFGLEKDLAKAYAWYRQVPLRGQQIAEIAAKLTPTQLAAAELEAGKLREQIKLNSEAAEVRPLDPDTIKVPEVVIPAPVAKNTPRALPAGNLLDGAVWEATGGGQINGKNLSIKDDGAVSTRVKAAAAAPACALIVVKLRHSRPQGTVAGAPTLVANLMLGDNERERLFMGLLVDPSVKERESTWYQTKKITSRFDGVKLHFGTAGKQAGSDTELADIKLVFFPTCEEAKKEGEKYSRP